MLTGDLEEINQRRVPRLTELLSGQPVFGLSCAGRKAIRLATVRMLSTSFHPPSVSDGTL